MQFDFQIAEPVSRLPCRSVPGLRVTIAIWIDENTQDGPKLGCGYEEIGASPRAEHCQPAEIGHSD